MLILKPAAKIYTSKKKVDASLGSTMPPLSRLGLRYTVIRSPPSEAPPDADGTLTQAHLFPGIPKPRRQTRHICFRPRMKIEGRKASLNTTVLSFSPWIESRLVSGRGGGFCHRPQIWDLGLGSGVIGRSSPVANLTASRLDRSIYEAANLCGLGRELGNDSGKNEDRDGGWGMGGWAASHQLKDNSQLAETQRMHFRTGVRL